MIITAQAASTAGGLVRLTVQFDSDTTYLTGAFGSNLTDSACTVTVTDPAGVEVGEATISAGSNMVPLPIPTAPIDVFNQFVFSFT